LEKEERALKILGARSLKKTHPRMLGRETFSGIVADKRKKSIFQVNRKNKWLVKGKRGEKKKKKKHPPSRPNYLKRKHSLTVTRECTIQFPSEGETICVIDWEGVRFELGRG